MNSDPQLRAEVLEFACFKKYSDVVSGAFSKWIGSREVFDSLPRDCQDRVLLHLVRWIVRGRRFCLFQECLTLLKLLRVAHPYLCSVSDWEKLEMGIKLKIVLQQMLNGSSDSQSLRKFRQLFPTFDASKPADGGSLPYLLHALITRQSQRELAYTDASFQHEVGSNLIATISHRVKHLMRSLNGTLPPPRLEQLTSLGSTSPQGDWEQLPDDHQAIYRAAAEGRLTSNYLMEKFHMDLGRSDRILARIIPKMFGSVERNRPQVQFEVLQEVQEGQKSSSTRSDLGRPNSGLPTSSFYARRKAGCNQTAQLESGVRWTEIRSQSEKGGCMDPLTRAEEVEARAVPELQNRGSLDGDHCSSNKVGCPESTELENGGLWQDMTECRKLRNRRDVCYNETDSDDQRISDSTGSLDGNHCSSNEVSHLDGKELENEGSGRDMTGCRRLRNRRDVCYNETDSDDQRISDSPGSLDGNPCTSNTVSHLDSTQQRGSEVCDPLHVQDCEHLSSGATPSDERLARRLRRNLLRLAGDSTNIGSDGGEPGSSVGDQSSSHEVGHLSSTQVQISGDPLQGQDCEPFGRDVATPPKSRNARRLRRNLLRLAGRVSSPAVHSKKVTLSAADDKIHKQCSIVRSVGILSANGYDSGGTRESSFVQKYTDQPFSSDGEDPPMCLAKDPSLTNRKRKGAGGENLVKTKRLKAGRDLDATRESKSIGSKENVGKSPDMGKTRKLSRPELRSTQRRKESGPVCVLVTPSRKVCGDIENVDIHSSEETGPLSSPRRDSVSSKEEVLITGSFRSHSQPHLGDRGHGMLRNEGGKTSPESRTPAAPLTSPSEMKESSEELLVVGSFYSRSLPRLRNYRWRSPPDGVPGERLKGGEAVSPESLISPSKDSISSKESSEEHLLVGSFYSQSLPSLRNYRWRSPEERGRGVLSGRLSLASRVQDGQRVSGNGVTGVQCKKAKRLEKLDQRNNLSGGKSLAPHVQEGQKVSEKGVTGEYHRKDERVEKLGQSNSLLKNLNDSHHPVRQAQLRQIFEQSKRYSTSQENIIGMECIPADWSLDQQAVVSTVLEYRGAPSVPRKSERYGVCQESSVGMKGMPIDGRALDQQPSAVSPVLQYRGAQSGSSSDGSVSLMTGRRVLFQVSGAEPAAQPSGGASLTSVVSGLDVRGERTEWQNHDSNLKSPDLSGRLQVIAETPSASRVMDGPRITISPSDDLSHRSSSNSSSLGSKSKHESNSSDYQNAQPPQTQTFSKSPTDPGVWIVPSSDDEEDSESYSQTSTRFPLLEQYLQKHRCPAVRRCTVPLQRIKLEELRMRVLLSSESSVSQD